METIIVICLIIIIVLLLQDKVVIQRPTGANAEPSPEQQAENNIMGQTKVVQRTEEPKRPLQSDKKESEPETPDPENTVDEQETDAPFPERVPADILDELPDPQQQWDSFEYPEASDDFSTSVTYDEISTVAEVLRQPDLPESSVQEETVRVVRKIQGTELFSLLENSIEDASQKIAKLLDQNINKAAVAGVAATRKNDLDNFDIGEFV